MSETGHGHEHAKQSGGGKGKSGGGVVRGLVEGLGGEILGGLVTMSLNTVSGIGEVVDQAARLGHKKSGGGGGGGGHH